jgi:hypothetical protein
VEKKGKEVGITSKVKNVFGQHSECAKEAALHP